MSDAKGEESEFEPLEEQPELEPLEGEPLEADLPPLDDGSADAEDAVPADSLAEDAPLGEDAPLVEEADAAAASEVLEEEEGAAFPAGEELAAAAEREGAEDEEDEDGEEKKKKKKGGGLIEAIKSASPYTVMLVMAFFALLLGILCLAIELGRYEWDFKAEGAKRGSALAPAIYAPAPSNTLAACPRAEKLSFSATGGAPSSGPARIT